jgi:hypothetical protein
MFVAVLPSTMPNAAAVTTMPFHHAIPSCQMLNHIMMSASCWLRLRLKLMWRAYCQWMPARAKERRGISIQCMLNGKEHPATLSLCVVSFAFGIATLSAW